MYNRLIIIKMKIKTLLIVCLSLVLTTNVFAQEEVIEDIIINATLFNQPNQGHYKFTVDNGAFTQGTREITNITQVVVVDTN